jgi:hypothetical protein
MKAFLDSAVSLVKRRSFSPPSPARQVELENEATVRWSTL